MNVPSHRWAVCISPHPQGPGSNMVWVGRTEELEDEENSWEILGFHMTRLLHRDLEQPCLPAETFMSSSLSKILQGWNDP